MTVDEVGDLIEAFLGDRRDIGDWDWDDFVSVRQKTPEIESLRIEVLRIETDFPPPPGQRSWCSEEGEKALREVVSRIRGT